MISLLADIASEMLYPVIPVYLKSIGFSILLIGVLEGVVNFLAGVSKGYFGKKSDEIGLRLPFVKWGYFLSALSKPLLTAMTFPLWIFSIRSVDRLGKGVRTAARDALLSQQSRPENKGKVFGFHRAMDTTGAAIGPVLALIFLYFSPGNYEQLFLLAFIPGLLSVALIFTLKEERQPQTNSTKGSFFSYLKYWKEAPIKFKKAMPGLLLFMLFNSADIFLLLITKESVNGRELVFGNVHFNADSITIGAYIFYNLIYALFSYPLGSLADRLGYRLVLVGGFLVYAIVYAGFSNSPSIGMVFGLFFLYGIYAAATEGITKAWISNLANVNQKATAIGFYTSMESIGALFASSIAGVLWISAGPGWTFMIPAIAAFITAIYLIYFLKNS
jgi:MFS family permease